MNQLEMTTPPTRQLGLFLVRESDENDTLLFDGMRNGTYIRYRQTRAIEEVRRAGMTPMTKAGGFYLTVRRKGRKEAVWVPVEVLQEGRTDAYLFCWEGFWHLWSKSSAVKQGSGGRATNEFTAILMRVVRRLRPRALLAGNFSRLIRNQWQGNHLLTALQGNVDLVIADDTTFPLSGENLAQGLMMFNTFAMVASMERNWIVQRLVTGRVAQWRRGEWPLGKGVVPFGYRWDKGTKTLTPDPSKKPQVEAMLKILLGGGPPAEMVRQLGPLGLRVQRQTDNKRWVRVSAASVYDPAKYVAGLFGWASLYCTGEYLLRYNNVFPGIRELAGVPVTYHDDSRNRGADSDDTAGRDLDDLAPDADGFTNTLERRISRFDGQSTEVDSDPGELQMLCLVGVPDGGWAAPEVLGAFAAQAMSQAQQYLDNNDRRLRPLAPQVRDASANHELLARTFQGRQRLSGLYGDRLNSSRSRRTGPPFSGRNFLEGPWYYEFTSPRTQMYRLIRHPIATAGLARDEGGRQMGVDVMDGSAAQGVDWFDATDDSTLEELL